MIEKSPSEIFVRAYTEKPGARPVAAKSRPSGDDDLCRLWCKILRVG